MSLKDVTNTIDSMILGNKRVAEAAQAVRVIVESHTWIHQRREVIRILDDPHFVSRLMSVELSVAQFMVARSTFGYKIPVGFTLKDQTRVISVTDESGCRVPTLTSSESTELAAEMLKVRARVALDMTESELSGALAERIAAVAATGADEAVAMIEELSDTAGGESSTWSGNAQTDSRLRADREFMWLARSLAWTVPLVAVVDAPPATRKIFTFDIESEMRNLPSFGTRLSASLGWSETTPNLSVPGVGLGASYEFDFEAPEGFQLTGAHLMVVNSDFDDVQPGDTGIESGSSRFVTVTRNDHDSHGHGRATLSMRIERGYASSVLMTGVFAAIVLTVGALRLPELSAAQEAGVAILLGVPALLTTIVARSLGSGPSRDLLVFTRGILLGSGLLAYVAAMALVLYPSTVGGGGEVTVDGTLESVWLAAAGLSWLLVAIQAVGVIDPWIENRRLRRAARRALSSSSRADA